MECTPSQPVLASDFTPKRGLHVSAGQEAEQPSTAEGSSNGGRKEESLASGGQFSIQLGLKLGNQVTWDYHTTTKIR